MFSFYTVKYLFANRTNSTELSFEQFCFFPQLKQHVKLYVQLWYVLFIFLLFVFLFCLSGLKNPSVEQKCEQHANFE